MDELGADCEQKSFNNMILHGDGSSNIFVQDGLLPFSSYSKEESLNKLSQSKKEKSYYNKELNELFDVIITNPPFFFSLSSCIFAKIILTSDEKISLSAVPPPPHKTL